MREETISCVIVAVLLAASAPSALAQETTYPVTIQNGPYSFTVEDAPERAVGIGTQQIEIMLALGLADRMVGTAFASSTPVLPEFEDEFNAIPSLAERNPSLEVVLGAEADFTYGTNRSYQDVAPLETLQEYGIAPMVPEADSVLGATMENVYSDIRNLGIIFDIQPRAQDLIAEMQAEIEDVGALVGDVSDPVSVLLYDGGTDTVLTDGQALSSYLIELAGGRNIFADMNERMVTVSLEEIVARNPDVIVVVDPYGTTTAEEKIAFLESSPAFASVTAVQNDNYVLVSLPALQPGVRNADAVRTMAEGFYPELFRE